MFAFENTVLNETRFNIYFPVVFRDSEHLTDANKRFFRIRRT